ncbi:hypothetical protein NW762_005742 [Fusarium torreyae]|uniref:Uncharacterized protein n=1 Tax=Fusarium torreyae TaxID=1237075 RepID=A0A9W8S585_9HYPO|nr:hypothetical protein NW762_005742 [Fusarium torreyae]
MVYYALLKYTTSEPNYRYLLAAPNAETIDEWWREASSKDSANVKRLAPDYYSWGSGAQAWNLVDPAWNNKIMYTLLNDRDARVMSTFNQPDRVDVISGEAYYIRSKSNPELYWLATKDGQIWATKQGRTRFIFRVDGEQGSDKNRTVIIGKDYISIRAVGDGNQKYVSVNDNSEVVLSGHSCRLYYSDLKRNYLAQGDSGTSGSAPVTKVDGYGEEWELVR